jgi:hypothetical protein
VNPSRTSRASVVLVTLFALASLGLSVVAWNQYKELIGLRTANVSAVDLEAEKKRAWDAEQRIRELEAQIAALRAGQPENAGNAETEANAAGENRTATADTNAPGRGGRGGRGGQDPAVQAAMQAVLQDPNYQRAQLLQQQAAIELRYAALFRSLNLTPDQMNQLKALLVDRQNLNQDIQAAAQAQGLQGGRGAIQELVQAGQSEIDTTIRSLIGEAAFAQYQGYESTVNQREQVTQLQSVVTLAGAPLSDAQVNQLVQTLAQNSTNGGGGNRGGRGGGGFGGPGGTNVSQQVLTAAQSILTPAQQQVVQQVQVQQSAQNQMNTLMNEATGGAVGGRGGRGGRGGGG